MLAVDSPTTVLSGTPRNISRPPASANWQTRIGSFKFPACTTEPTGLLSGTVTDASLVPLAGATIDVTGGYTTLTDPTGHYSLNLVSGTYTVTASKYGYLPGTAPAWWWSHSATTTQDFALTAAPTSTISGVVTDAATGWPLYASLEIAGYPYNPIFTNPVTGAYSVALVNGPYSFTVTAMSGGYVPAVQPLVVSANATEDFALTADLVACSAPGYQLIIGTTLASDGFDSSTAPAFSANWGIVDVSGTTGDWVARTTSLHPAGITPHSAPKWQFSIISL